VYQLYVVQCGTIIASEFQRFKFEFKCIGVADAMKVMVEKHVFLLRH